MKGGRRFSFGRRSFFYLPPGPDGMPVACTERKKDGSPLDGPSLLSFFYLLCAEDAVAGISQPWNDIGVIVELFVHCSHIDLHIGMILLNTRR